MCVCVCVWMCVCVCVCVCLFARACVHFGFVWFQFDVIFGSFFTLLSGFEVHFGTFLVLGGSLGLPWGALGSSWAPGCPQEGLKERKVGSLDPPWGPRFGSRFGYFCNLLRLKTHQKNIDFLMDL